MLASLKKVSIKARFLAWILQSVSIASIKENRGHDLLQCSQYDLPVFSTLPQGAEGLYLNLTV